MITGQFAKASARNAANVRLVELAVGVLQRKPNSATRDLRTWAISVIDRYSDVDLSPTARAALADSLTLPGTIWLPGEFVRVYAPWEKGRPFVVISCDVRGHCDTLYTTRPESLRPRRGRPR